MITRIINGGVNMPAFGRSLKPEELARIAAFVESRNSPCQGRQEKSKTSESVSQEIAERVFVTARIVVPVCPL